MADEPKSKLWVFLNSSFGLFLMSSIVVSFITWSYTQWTDSLEAKKVLSERVAKLDTEISYRVQVLQNYFESECSEHSNLSRKTFKDIDEIYGAAPSYQAIFQENAGKDLHILIWEFSAVQKEDTKHLYISCFDSLLQFNAYLNRLQNQVDSQNQFYGEAVNYEKEVAMLTGKFTSALGLLNSEFVPTAKLESPIVREEEHEKSARPTTLQFSSQELLTVLDESVPIPERDVDKPFLLPVEDVFSITGRGTVVTGRIDRGKIHVGDEVELVGLGAKRKTVVTSVEVFRKVLDEAGAGDNVGLMLRGIGKEEIKRGMVLTIPGSITPHTQFNAEVYVLTKDEGGRHTAFFNGYRPQFYFRTTDVTGSIQLPDGVEMVMPGDHISVNVELISDIAMEKGLRFAVREGGRMVGAGIVTSIIEDAD